MVFSITALTAEESSGSPFATLIRQAVHIAVGLVLAMIVSRIKPETLKRFSTLAFVFAVFSLVLVLIPGLGAKAGGAQRWLQLGPLRFQPGEFAKIATVLFFSAFISRHHERMRLFGRGIVLPALVVGILALLLLLQPDFGSVVVISLVTGLQLWQFVRIGHIGLLAVTGALTLSTIAVTTPYRLRRLHAFLDPFKDPSNSGYQLIQSLIAVGSGGFWGRGLGGGEQKLYYLPAAETDFIFAVICEELGFVGAISVALIYLCIAWRGFRLARRHAGEPFLSSLAIGATSLIVLPAFINMSVVLGLLPTKGLALPLVSYGGSSIICTLLAVGVLWSLSRHSLHEELKESVR